MIEPVVRSMMSRRQLQSPARPDDVRTLEDHLLFYCDRERMRGLDFLLNAPRSVSGDVYTQHSRGPVDDLRTVCRSLQQQSLDAIIVDVTLPEIAAAGLRVVRTIVPGLIPLTFGQRFAAKGGERLYQVPVRLGHRAVPLREDQLNPAPHPFA
jgi:ribosomal protein S12 methylthiotransferase accessory factor